MFGVLQDFDNTCSVFDLICSILSLECYNYTGLTTSVSSPKCHHHQGDKTGFAVAEMTDLGNKKMLVIHQIIVSFKYADEEKKEERARRECYRCN